MRQIQNFLSFTYLRFAQKLIDLLLWSLVWILLISVFASLFDSFKGQGAEFDKLITTLPPALAETFNISQSYVSKAESFLSGQFLTLYLLVSSIFAFISGNYVIAGKIEDKVITTWLTKSLSRSTLYLAQGFVNVLFFWLSGLLVWSGAVVLFELLSTSSLDTSYAFSGFISTAMLITTWAFIGQASGSVLSSKINQGLGIGVILISFFMNSLSNIEGYPDWLKPLSLFYYVDIPALRDDFLINWDRLWVLPVIGLIGFVIGLLFFRKRDIAG
jgi:hypothetical protein